MPKYVVISGKKQHGKNTLARLMQNRLKAEGFTCTEVAFADPIKNFVTDVFGIPREDMETEEGKQKVTHIRWSDINEEIAEDLGKGSYFDDPREIYHSPVFIPSDDLMTVREILQVVGTDVFRKRFYDPIWAMAPFMKEHTYPVYDKEDGIFLGEAPYDIIFITDCRFPNEVDVALEHQARIIRVIREDYQGDNDTHPSETALDDYEWKSWQIARANTGDGKLELYAEQFVKEIVEELAVK